MRWEQPQQRGRLEAPVKADCRKEVAKAGAASGTSGGEGEGVRAATLPLWQAEGQRRLLSEKRSLDRRTSAMTRCKVELNSQLEADSRTCDKTQPQALGGTALGARACSGYVSSGPWWAGVWGGRPASCYNAATSPLCRVWPGETQTWRAWRACRTRP